MDYVDLAAHVTAMVTTIVGLIYATWPRQRAFPLWSALLKVTLLALFVWVLALGIDFALRSVMAPPRPTAEHGDVEGQQAADDDEDPPAREPVFGRIRGSPRNGPWPIMRLHPSGGVDHP